MGDLGALVSCAALTCLCAETRVSSAKGKPSRRSLLRILPIFLVLGDQSSIIIMIALSKGRMNDSPKKSRKQNLDGTDLPVRPWDFTTLGKPLTLRHRCVERSEACVSERLVICEEFEVIVTRVFTIRLGK